MISVDIPHISTDIPRQLRLDKFAEYVSELPWFNSYVLHKFYINVFNPADSFNLRAITCADLLLSPFVVSTGYNVFAFEPQVQSELRAKMAGRKEERKLIAEFLLAFSIECRKHFLSPKHLESFRLQGNLILNPSAEAERITQHIVNRINSSRTVQQKKNSVDYFIELLENEGQNSRHQELLKLLKGFQQYDKESGEVPDEWKNLLDVTQTAANSVTIKIERDVREKILNIITDSQQTTTGLLHSLIIGINNYTDTRIFPLEGCVNDAHAVNSFLQGNLLPGRSGKLDVLIDRDATRDSLLLCLAQTAVTAKPQDSFLMYFSGYGGMEEIMLAKTEPSLSDKQIAKYLVCHDTSSDNKGLSLSELEYLLSMFPKGCTITVLLDCSFERYSTSFPPGTKVRSLPWKEAARPESQFEWTKRNDEYDPANPFKGVIFYAAYESDAYEISRRGNFTKALFDAVKQKQNIISFSELSTGNNSMRFTSTAQSPMPQSFGGFNLDKIFLDGHLKKSESKDTQFFIEHGMDKDFLVEFVHQYLNNNQDTFQITEGLPGADYILRWESEDMVICKNDEYLTPITSIDISNADTLNQAVEIFSHLAAWERVMQMTNTDPELQKIVLKMIESRSNSGEQELEIIDGQVELDYVYREEGKYRTNIYFELSNHESVPVYHALLYLTNRGEVSCIDWSATPLNPGQTIRFFGSKPLLFEMDKYLEEGDLPYCECYFKLIVHKQRIEYIALEQGRLSEPKMKSAYWERRKNPSQENAFQQQQHPQS